MNISNLRRHVRASLADAMARSVAPTPGLTQFRTRGLWSLCLFGWLCTAAFIILSWTVTLHLAGPAILVSVLLNVMPTIAVRRARYDAAAWLPGALMAALQPAVLVFLLQDHHWQMEGHMFFFVGLAALALLCDWRPLVIATLTVALHHLVLGFFLPSWVFMGGWAVARVMIHAAAVIFVLILSARMSLLTSGLLNQQSSVGDEQERIANEAEASRTVAEDALAALRRAGAERRAERERRERAEASARQARVAEMQSLGTEFENSVAGIAAAVSAAAIQLEYSARNMSRFARTTGEQAAEVMNQAHRASESAGQVSHGVSALSRSIQSVAQSSSEQSLLGEAARHSTSEGERTLRALAERTANVGAFIELIKGVATQTNLLALNATIEAARAGEAGRGFAVVANEVKTLAAKARTATDEVTELVSTIGTGAERADRALSDVAAAMSTMLEHASTVKKEIERQRSTAAMIERTAEQSASGVGVMSQHCTQVAHAASEASKLSSEVQESATRLAAIAQELQGATGQFVAQLRAA